MTFSIIHSFLSNLFPFGNRTPSSSSSSYPTNTPFHKSRYQKALLDLRNTIVGIVSLSSVCIVSTNGIRYDFGCNGKRWPKWPIVSLSFQTAHTQTLGFHSQIKAGSLETANIKQHASYVNGEEI